MARAQKNTGRSDNFPAREPLAGFLEADIIIIPRPVRVKSDSCELPELRPHNDTQVTSSAAFRAARSTRAVASDSAVEYSDWSRPKAASYSA